MSKSWKAVIAIAVVASTAFLGNQVVDDGGIIPVISDEVPPLVDQWVHAEVGEASRLAAFIPATGAALLGYRAGEADYDKEKEFDTLTAGIPYEYQDNIMANDNLAAALRARRRQLARLVSNAKSQYFFDLFPDWWASHTACMTQQNRLETIKQLAPEIAWRIETTNTEFAALAEKETTGTLTVSEREAYLAHDLRVPHLVQLPASPWQLSGDWITVDPSDLFSKHESEGPLVRECPLDDRSYGSHIKACFGYVNIDLYGNAGQSPGYGHLAPTILGRQVYRNMEQSGATRDFVLQMMEHQSEQATLQRQAAKYVANLPASDVSAGSEERHVRAEYERLQCAD